MRDMNYVRESGEKVPVSQITDAELHDLVSSELCITDCDDTCSTVTDVYERLKIEIVRRKLEL
jgi:hypothetical protein